MTRDTCSADNTSMPFGFTFIDVDISKLENQITGFSGENLKAQKLGNSN